MKKLALLILVFSFSQLNAQDYNIIPKPVKLIPQKGNFIISKNTVLVLLDEGERNTANFLNEYLQQFYGFRLKTAKSAKNNYIRITTKKFIRPGQEGKYEMQISPASINISGDTYSGSFYAIQSLIQLLPVAKATSLAVPAVSIEDYPRFEYRGLHLDVARHFMPVDFVKKYIDYIALHKMNYFHWHLTEDQGWRIEIKKYPKLTQIGAYRNGTPIGRSPGKGSDNIRYGGFYTQEQVKDVVAYAAKRFITIIPEIEMPGHGGAAIAAYNYLSCFPEEKTKIRETSISDVSKASNGKLVQEAWGVFDDVFCAGKDSTFQFLQDVIDEIIPLFPSPYIHIGGDECPKNNWKRCPNCQKRIKENNLKDEHELQSYFIQRMEKYINSKGKTIIGWDEILEGGLAPNAIVMSWRGEKGGIDAAKENHKVIMSPTNYVYFDYSQTKNEDSITIGSYVPLDVVYNYNPVPKDLPADKIQYILGAQANVWTEYMRTPRKIEYMIFPRVSALSEVLWTPLENKDYADFSKRLPKLFRRYDLWKTNYSNAFYEMKVTVGPAPFDGKVHVKVETADKDQPVKYEIDGKQKNLLPGNSIVVMEDDKITFTSYRNNKQIQKIEYDFHLNKATGRKISLTKEPITNYPGNGGAFGLVNGLRSEKGMNSTEWLGWRGDDMEAVIDLSKSESVSAVSVHALSRGGSRTHAPNEVQVFGSDDGQNFKLLGTGNVFVADKSEAAGNITAQFPATNVRYVKVLAKNYLKIPEGKSGAGDPALMMIDEIEVK
ncbi:MAG TPA: family 20 glycosylhydrolase [Chitinophagaceae bacterium]|nr:family 20 glycosylhydrolase [Chitinophagaceae bacterium]